MFRPASPLLATTLLGLGACGGALSTWGTTPGEARRNADEAAAGFAIRFTNVDRDARFAAARPLMGQYALAPSRLYRDSSLWTVRNAPDSSQALYLNAVLERDRYTFRSLPMAPYPNRLGGERHYLRLRKLSGGQYEWVTIVDHAIGSASAASIGAGVRALLTSFEGKSGHEVRRDLARSLPLSSRELGRLARINALTTTVEPRGATTLTLEVAWQPDSLRSSAPAFAGWVDKYIVPADFAGTIRDAQGNPFLEARGTPGRMHFVVRAHQGRWVSLYGPPRPMPDSLVLHLDASAKFKMFRVSFRKLVGTLVLEGGPHDRTLFFRWQNEPEWRFPLAANRLIRTPLRTPFRGRGIELRLGVRDDLAQQTMSLRHLRLVVHESAIMRWLGNLGATAFGDYEGQVEVEENRFLAAFFEAIRRDVASLAP